MKNNTSHHEETQYNKFEEMQLKLVKFLVTVVEALLFDFINRNSGK